MAINYLVQRIPERSGLITKEKNGSAAQFTG